MAEVIQPYTNPSYIGNSVSVGFNVELKNKVYLFVFNQDGIGPCLYSIYKNPNEYQSIKLCGEGNAVITINGSIANLKGSGDYGGHGFVVGL